MVIISLSTMLFLGFLATGITKMVRLPNVTAYILTGIIIGPFCLNIIPKSIVEGMEFLPDIALAFIAFSTGEFFKFEKLKENGLSVVIITITEAILASLLVFAVMYFGLSMNFSFSIVLAALAAATAPASTIMTIRQTGAKGEFVNTLLQVVALDDIVGILAYSISISLAITSFSGSSISLKRIFIPIAENIGVLILGAIFGWILNRLIKGRSKDNRLIISIATMFAFCGICALFDISPLLGCMSMGTIYINISEDDRLFKQLNYFSPPILLLFFVRSGISFDLSVLFDSGGKAGKYPLLFVAFLYFSVRIVGKYLGAYIGAAVTKRSGSIRKFLGFALVPQAGVAIGLAALGARTLKGENGNILQTIILATSVMYEIIGPACAKAALFFSKSYSDKIEDIAVVEEADISGKRKSDVDILIERIQKIQQEIPDHEESEEEREFTKAAEEYDAYIPPIRRRFFGRR